MSYQLPRHPFDEARRVAWLVVAVVSLVAWTMILASLAGCATVGQRGAIERGAVVSAAAALGSTYALHQQSYSAAAAGARMAAKLGNEGFAGYEARMQPIDRIFWARSRALQVASDALYRAATLLDEGGQLGRADVALLVRALSALVGALDAGAVGLDPLPLPPAVLTLLNLLSRELGSQDGGADARLAG